MSFSSVTLHGVTSVDLTDEPWKTAVGSWAKTIRVRTEDDSRLEITLFAESREVLEFGCQPDEIEDAVPGATVME